MRKAKIIVLFSFLFLASLMTVANVTPALAKNLNLPDGANKVGYYDAAGLADIALPTPLPAGYPSSATAMRFSFAHVDTTSDGSSFDNLVVWLYMKPTGSQTLVWEPFAVITTDQMDATFERTLWHGSFVEFDATLYPPAPISYGTDNVKVVSESALSVTRHGNDVTINLNEPQTLKRPLSASTTFIVPAFSLELNKYGGSMHDLSTHLWAGYPGASGYTMIQDEMSFNANGDFTSIGSTFDGAPVSNGFVIMHGDHTFYPPL